MRVLLQRAARLLLRALATIEVRGLERLPQGAVLLAPNHLSHLDPALVVAVLPDPPELVGLSDLQRRIVAPIFALYGVIPVRRDTVDREMLRQVTAVLERGQRLLIFPEARISRSGGLEAGRVGIGYLSLHTGAPVMPVALTGTDRLLADLLRGRRGRLTITFAPPIPPDSISAPSRREQRARLTQLVMSRLAAYLPPDYRGIYAGESTAGGTMILHIIEADRWRAAQETGEYRADSLDTDGFIHFSAPDQLLRVANYLYEGQRDLLLLRVEPERLLAPLRWEANVPEGERFPHLYGPLNLDAVSAVLPFPPAEDGRFRSLPPLDVD